MMLISRDLILDWRRVLNLEIRISLFSFYLLFLFSKMERDVPNLEFIEAEIFTSREDTFPHDPEVTDFTLIVEGRKLHVVKAVLIDASQVFRRMLTGEFKENNTSELELPGKKYTSFELLLRCLFPREYTLTGTT